MNEIEDMEENDFMPKFHSENNVDAIKQTKDFIKQNDQENINSILAQGTYTRNNLESIDHPIETSMIPHSTNKSLESVAEGKAQIVFM